MSGISCKAIGFHLVLPDLTCVFFQKDGQKTSVKVFGSCWPEIKENNTCYISPEASLGFHCAVTLTPPGKAHPIPRVTGGVPSAWPLTGVTCTPGSDRRLGSAGPGPGTFLARVTRGQHRLIAESTQGRSHSPSCAVYQMIPLALPSGTKLCFSFNSRTNIIDFSVYRGKEKTTQAKSSSSSTCFKYNMWCVLFLF